MDTTKMRSRPCGSLASLICLMVFAAGCATTNQPERWLSTAGMQDSVGFGGWARVWTDTQKVSSKVIPAVQGELIAVHPDSIYLLSNDCILAGVPVSSVKEVHLTAYNGEAAPSLNAWYAIGAVLTPAHGWFLALELPAWFLVGGIATSAASNVPEFEWPDETWDVIRRYARFPQGLPPGLNRSLLLPKMTQEPAGVAGK